MTTTSDGKAKVIDIIDCSGSGDVAMGALAAAVTTTKDGIAVSTLLGLSGKSLKLNNYWKNPTGQYRLGIKVFPLICFVNHFRLKCVCISVAVVKFPYFIDDF